MTLEQKIDLLLSRQITRTRFITVPITNTPNKGIPIGQGACIAVRLKVNALQRNSPNGAGGIGGLLAIYYGDAQSQENEILMMDNNSAILAPYPPLIFCKDLSEVFVRQSQAQSGASVVNVQVTIYY